MKVTGFFTCECGKLHTLAGGRDAVTLCSCGLKLYPQAIRVAQARAAARAGQRPGEVW